VVVLDVKMSGMDGNEALREIKILEPELEVIMLTGYGSLGSVLEGWHEGVFAYLTKPSSIDFLADRIREAFDRKTGVSGQERRVKDIMEPLPALIKTIHQDQSMTEAIEAMCQFFAEAITATKRKEALLRSILVTGNGNKIIGVISLTDLLRGLQPPCMRLSDDRPTMADSAYLDPPNYLGNFATMVREMASKRVSELMPDKPPTIDANADLLQAANRLLSLRVQSLLVMDGDEAVGVVRDKDLFLEMASIVREHPAEAGAS
jgi:CBS domain-containing protein